MKNDILENMKMHAAKMYLNNTGRYVIDEIGDCLIYEDDGVITVGKVHASANPITDETCDCRMSRKEFEDVIYQVMLRNPEVFDSYLRPDNIELFIANEGRALIRHYVNAGVREA